MLNNSFAYISFNYRKCNERTDVGKAKKLWFEANNVCHVIHVIRLFNNM
jgi:hypothetical protein